MKTICLFAAFAVLNFVSFAQGPADQGAYDDLMKRSRRAKTTAIIMVSTGPVIAAAGIGTLIYGLVQNETAEYDYYYDNNGNYIQGDRKRYNTEIAVGATAAVVGLGVALSSIAFSNKSDDLRRDAKRLKLKASTDRILIPGLNGFANGTKQVKMSLVIPL